jgi:1-acylglycerone phosphate reductase
MRELKKVQITKPIIGLEEPAIEAELVSIKAMFEINVFGVMEMVKQFSPLLIAAKGTIVNHGSTPLFNSRT